MKTLSKILFISGMLILQLAQSYFAQQVNVDSLIKILKSPINDTLKIEAVSELFLAYEFEDTIKAEKFLNLEIQLSKKAKNKIHLATAYSHYGFFVEDKGKYIEAIDYHKKAIELYKNNPFSSIKEKAKNLSACYNNIALIQSKIGNYNEALNNFLTSLKIDDLLGDSLGVSISYSNIGIIHREQNNYDKAIEYYYKSLDIAEKIKNSYRISACYNNLGLAYYYKKDYKKALNYITKSLEYNEKEGDSYRKASCYNNLGNIYLELSNYDKSLYYYKQSLTLREKMGDKEGIASVYGNIASLEQRLNKIDESIINAHKSLLISKEIGSLPLQLTAYGILSEQYAAKKDFKNAYLNHKLYKQINDSIYSIEGSRQIKGLEARYQNEKKQKEIELLNKDKLLKESELRSQKNQKIASFIGFTLMLLLFIIIYKNYHDKKKANALLYKQNIEIKAQKEEIQTQRDEIKSQRDSVTKQKEVLEEMHKKITDSINYAKRIQDAVLPISEAARSIMDEHFILFKPKDIVSGDFYWATQIDNWLIVAVADCTGHGVPGAFMSMLGISFLNEIVRKKEITKTNEVLNELKKEIVNALQQKGVSGEQKDGMDIAIIAINKNTGQCQFSGANNPLYYVKKIQTNAENNEPSFELIEYKGDKMPVAIYERMNDFTNHEIKLEQGDMLYLFSDGYADQFGGENGKKFMYKRFKELILTNAHKTMEKQKEILENTIEKWIGNGEQTDDITVVGIKI